MSNGVMVPTILVADDNSNIQKMVTLALKEAGIAVVAVGNGEAAVRKLPDVRPDLVLADIFMPVKNGYEVCEFVKGDERFAHIPVVLLVGAFDPLDEHEVERVHADGVLKKPFVPPDPLIAMVTSLLEKGASAAAGSPAVAAALAGTDAAPVVRPEKTQQLTVQEIAALTKQGAGMAPAPEPEPEPEQFGTKEAALTIDDEHAPVAFGDMLAEEETHAEEEEEEGEESEETEEPAFEASSVSGLHMADAGARHEAPAAEPAAEKKPEDHWAGIKEEAKQPDPERPPIAVEFGESAPVELVTDETRGSGPHLEVRPDPALVSSANDWMSARPPAAAPEPSPTAPESDFEPMRIEAESPAPRPLASIADDLRAEAAHAAPVHDMEETQQFVAPAASAVPHAVEREEHHEEYHEAHEAEALPPPPAASTWGRVEDVMLPAVPLVAGVTAAIHSHLESAEHAAPVHAAPVEPATPFSSAPPPPTTSDTGVGADMLIAAITQKVMDQLDPKMIEKLSRELVRPLIEALIRREIDKD